MGLLDGKRLLITGVLTDASLAFAVPAWPRRRSRDRALGRRPRPVADPAHGAQAAGSSPRSSRSTSRPPSSCAPPARRWPARWDRLDGLLHAIGFAPPDCLGNGMFAADWDDVSTALQISTYSLKALVDAFLPLLRAAGGDGGASVVGLDFDATVAWPVYDWMGVAKAGLESLSRYLAKELGPRASGSTSWRPAPSAPWRPSPSRGSPPSRTPGPTGPRWLGRARRRGGGQACLALFSDLFPMTTGEILHVDGGVHAVGGLPPDRLPDAPHAHRQSGPVVGAVPRREAERAPAEAGAGR